MFFAPSTKTSSKKPRPCTPCPPFPSDRSSGFWAARFLTALLCVPASQGVPWGLFGTCGRIPWNAPFPKPQFRTLDSPFCKRRQSMGFWAIVSDRDFGILQSAVSFKMSHAYGSRRPRMKLNQAVDEYGVLLPGFNGDPVHFWRRTPQTKKREKKSGV